MSHPRGVALGFPPLQYTELRQSQSFGCRNLTFTRVLLLTLVHAGLALSAFATCTAPQNAIEAENCLPGNPQSNWYVNGTGSTNIQGFSTDISVNVGETV